VNFQVVVLNPTNFDSLSREQLTELGLKGTMNMEEQQPDDRFMEELLKQEENQLLQGPNVKLWEE